PHYKPARRASKHVFRRPASRYAEEPFARPGGVGYTTRNLSVTNRRPQIMTDTIKHPLEPLTASEVQLAVSLLKDHAKVTPTTRFLSVSLKEPDKQAVHRFTGKEPIRREAFAVLFDNGTNSCYEATLSLTDRKVLSWKHVPGVQPTMTVDEQVECEQAVLAS